jgi:hypothetical protein
MQNTLEEKWKEFLQKDIDYSQLPPDCQAAAAERMRQQYAATRTFDIRDRYIVLGNPNRGVVQDGKVHFSV